VGECTSCSKRTGANRALFPEVKAKDTCTDPACYKAKLAAQIERTKTEYREKDEELIEVCKGYVYGPDRPKKALEHYAYRVVDKKKPCDHAKPAIVVAGEEIGSLLLICTDNNCKQHGRGGRSGYRRSPAEIARQKEKAERDRQRMESLRRARVQMVEAVTGLGQAEQNLIAAVLARTLDADGARMMCKDLGLDVQPDKNKYRDYRASLLAWVAGLKGLELRRGMVNLALFRLTPTVSWISADEFYAVAAEREVDVKAIARQVAAEAKAAEKKKAAKKAAKGAKKTKRERKAVKAEGGAK